MATQKQRMPSFESRLSVTVPGFLRVELELHEQKNRINAGCLENTDLENKSVRDTSKRPCN